MEDEALKMPEPTPLMSAKTYKTKYAEPFIKKLIKIIKDLARRCFRAEKEAEQARKKLPTLEQENKQLKSRNWDLKMGNSKMGVQVRQYHQIKDYLGTTKINELLKSISAAHTKAKWKSERDMDR